jgi:hypothetical protein
MMHPRCLLIALPALMLTAFEALGSRGAADRAVVSPAAEELVERRGRVSAWYVFADGTVAVRLDGHDKDQGFSAWFVTPADQTETTRFEHLMLATAMSLSSSSEPLTIAYELNKEKVGKSIKDAIPIKAVMWNTTLAEAENRPDKDARPKK